MSAKGFPSESRSSEALLCAVAVSAGVGPNRSTIDCEGAGADDKNGLFAAELVGDWTLFWKQFKSLPKILVLKRLNALWSTGMKYRDYNKMSYFSMKPVDNWWQSFSYIRYTPKSLEIYVGFTKLPVPNIE